MEINEIKKELYKSKVDAEFSHYQNVDGVGYLFYTIQLEAGLFQLRISTIEKITEKVLGYDTIKLSVDIQTIKLSSDLGTTAFNNKIKASELNRWIVKAIEENTFFKIG